MLPHNKGSGRLVHSLLAKRAALFGSVPAHLSAIRDGSQRPAAVAPTLCVGIFHQGTVVSAASGSSITRARSIASSTRAGNRISCTRKSCFDAGSSPRALPLLRARKHVNFLTFKVLSLLLAFFFQMSCNDSWNKLP